MICTYSIHLIGFRSLYITDIPYMGTAIANLDLAKRVSLLVIKTYGGHEHALRLYTRIVSLINAHRFALFIK